MWCRLTVHVSLVDSEYVAPVDSLEPHQGHDGRLAGWPLDRDQPALYCRSRAEPAAHP